MLGFSFSKMRSVQLKIGLVAGLCLTATSVVLIGYSLFSAQVTHRYVSSSVMTLVDSQTKESLLNRAYGEATAIKVELDAAFDVARVLAQSFAVLVDDKNNATPNDARRAQLNSVLRNVLQFNPMLNGTYSAWEPDALDGRDAAFKGQKLMGSDHTGRFLPYWTRNASGAIAVQPLVEYDSNALHGNGLAKGGWYLNPLATGKETILGPLPYIVQGQSVFLATMSVPIVIDGKVRGVAGADYNLEFVQKLAVSINASLFEGKGKVAILNEVGLIVANSANQSLIGKSAVEGDKRWAGSLSIVKGGKAVVLDEPEHANIDIYSPIKLGLTNTPWSVLISIPREIVLASAIKLDAGVNEQARSSTFWQLGIGALIVFAAVFSIAMFARSIAAPTRRCAAFANGIAKGDFDQTLEIQQEDEVGILAGALRTMQADLKQGIAQRIVDQAQADSERRSALYELAGQFESSVGEIVDTVASASTELEATATTLTSTAARSQEQAVVVAAASEEASTNVQSVASATEEMASSVTEISRQVQDSAKMAADAVAQAQKTNDRVSALSKAADRIGDVVELISNIAGQTNLLALNATIEAARAGDAGRGFAVVASEVKALAEQTAKATGEIGQQINSIQAATSESVLAIKEISHTIGRMSEISSAIAAAIEEQGAATHEISRNVQQAAQGTMQVTANIVDVQRGAAETGSASSQVLSAAQSLSSDSNRLKLEVGKFLSSVRAS